RPAARDPGGRGRWVPRARRVARRAHPRDRLHQSHREGSTRMNGTTTTVVEGLPATGAFSSTPTVAFGALLLRDLSVLRKEFVQFIARTVMQPLLFVFLFAYLFPKIGQGVGGAAGAAAFSSLLVPGVVAIACIFQGIQAVALPLVQDFGYSREIEDRIMAPLPVWGGALGEVVGGGIRGLGPGADVVRL